MPHAEGLVAVRRAVGGNTVEHGDEAAVVALVMNQAFFVLGTREEFGGGPQRFPDHGGRNAVARELGEAH